MFQVWILRDEIDSGIWWNILEILELSGFQFSSLEKLQLHDATNLSSFQFTNIKITKKCKLHQRPLFCEDFITVHSAQRIMQYTFFKSTDMPVLAKIFWKFTVFPWKFDLSQIKWVLVSSTITFAYVLPHELPIKLRPRIWEN